MQNKPNPMDVGGFHYLRKKEVSTDIKLLEKCFFMEMFNPGRDVL